MPKEEECPRLEEDQNPEPAKSVLQSESWTHSIVTGHVAVHALRWHLLFLSFGTGLLDAATYSDLGIFASNQTGKCLIDPHQDSASSDANVEPLLIAICVRQYDYSLGRSYFPWIWSNLGGPTPSSRSVACLLPGIWHHRWAIGSHTPGWISPLQRLDGLLDMGAVSVAADRSSLGPDGCSPDRPSASRRRGNCHFPAGCIFWNSSSNGQVLRRIRDSYRNVDKSVHGSADGREPLDEVVAIC